MVVEAELLRDQLAVLEDLEARRVLLGREVAGLVEQQHVGVGLDIARDARIAVPVPGAADVAAPLTEADVGEAGLRELVPEQETGEAGADDDDIALVGQRLALDRLGRVVVFEIAGEGALHLHVVVGTAAGLDELALLGLRLGVERDVTPGLRDAHQLGGVEDVVALPDDPSGRLPRPGVEQLLTRGGIDANGRDGWRAHRACLLTVPAGGLRSGRRRSLLRGWRTAASEPAGRRRVCGPGGAPVEVRDRGRRSRTHVTGWPGERFRRPRGRLDLRGGCGPAGG